MLFKSVLNVFGFVLNLYIFSGDESDFTRL